MASPPPVAAQPAAREPLLWFALALAWAWVAVPAALNPGQQGDHFEQFTWAHSLEWGYHKHPPLPTWLLGAAVRLFGASPYAAYGVAALVITGTAVFTWLLARELLGARLASLAIVLWGLQWAFSWKAQLLNHNTTMMCCVAAAAWLALRASRHGHATGWWLAFGLASGLAMLSKYQSAVPLAGIVLALWRGGFLGTRSRVLGLVAGVAVSAVLFAPHVAWMVQNDFSTLRYASGTAHQLDAAGRFHKLATFSALQLRMVLPALLCMGALALWSRRDRVPPSEGGMHASQRRAWLLGLTGWPLAVLAVMCLAQGVRLQDHWGFQATQFVSVWLAWQLRGLGPRAGARLAVLALLVHAVAMGVYSRSVWDPRTLAKRDRPDQFYPARQLADAVMREWKRITPCPLRYVVGPTYEAGMVSVYSGANPQVLEAGEPRYSPWVDLLALREAGAVHVKHSPDGLPGPLHKQAFTLPGGEVSLYDVYWSVSPPQDCRSGG